MRKLTRTLSPTLLLMLLLPFIIIAAAHTAVDVEHGDHCVLCLLYRSMVSAGVAVVVWRVFPTRGRTCAVPLAPSPIYGERPRPLGRSPPLL